MNNLPVSESLQCLLPPPPYLLHHPTWRSLETVIFPGLPAATAVHRILNGIRAALGSDCRLKQAAIYYRLVAAKVLISQNCKEEQAPSAAQQEVECSWTRRKQTSLGHKKGRGKSIMWNVCYTDRRLQYWRSHQRKSEWVEVIIVKGAPSCLMFKRH